MSRPWNIAIIGFGKIARGQHVRAIAENPDFQLAAIVSHSARDEAVPVFRTLEEALASDVPLDAVSVCTPPQVRHDICELATASGLAVMLEKPPAATVEEARILAAMAEHRKTVIFAAWHSRFAPFVDTAQEWCANKAALNGEILWHEDHAKWHPGQEWLWRAGGFGVFDPGINALSILTAIRPGAWHLSDAVAERPKNAETPIAARFNLGRGDDRVSASFSFEAEDTETWTIRLAAPDGETLCLTEGGAALSLNGRPLERRHEDEYSGVYQRFAELVRADRSEMDIAPLDLVEHALLDADVEVVGPVAV